MLFWLFLSLSCHHLVILLSSYHHHIMSPCHLVIFILSSCHLVTRVEDLAICGWGFVHLSNVFNGMAFRGIVLKS